MALDLFERMEEAGICPDVITYNTLIDARAKGGQCHKALDLFEQMERKVFKLTVESLIGL